jgi:uncharacterized membrane protein
MLATVAWIGGLAALAWLVLPAARKSMAASEYAQFLDNLQKRFDPLAWFSLVILAGTGMLQMGANPNYEGFFSIGNLWSGAILIKHLLFLAMTCVSAYLTWGLLPQMRRLSLLRARDSLQLSIKNQGQPAGICDLEMRILRQEEHLTRLNLILGVLVLALTAVARAV